MSLHYPVRDNGDMRPPSNLEGWLSPIILNVVRPIILILSPFPLEACISRPQKIHSQQTRTISTVNGVLYEYAVQRVLRVHYFPVSWDIPNFLKNKEDVQLTKQCYDNTVSSAGRPPPNNFLSFLKKLRKLFGGGRPADVWGIAQATSAALAATAG